MRRFLFLSAFFGFCVAPLHASGMLSIDDVERGFVIDPTAWDIAAIEAGVPLDMQAVGRLGTGLPMAGAVGGGGSQLTIADLSNDGCGLGPYTNIGSTPYAGTDGPYAIARRDSDGHYFIIGGDGHVNEFHLTLTTPCPSDLTTLTPADIDQDWGLFPAFDAGTNQYPGGVDGGAFVMGAWYDQVNNWICTSWTGTYSFVTQHNSWGCASFGASSLVTVGCWYTSNSDTNQQSTGSNILDLPTNFLSTYGLAAGSKAIGDGGALGTYNAGMSNGPSLVVLSWPPTSNSCSGHVDHDAGAGTTIVHYEVNNVGPTCGVTGASGPCTGCSRLASPNTCDALASYTSPTPPYSAKTSHKTYSLSGDTSDWDPSPNQTPTTGYLARAFIKTVIYDDGVKSGYVVPFTMPHGFINRTILASPAPSYTATCYLSFYDCLTFTLSSTDTGDGTTIQVGDFMWVLTCVVGTDGAGCSATNANFLSHMIVTSVNHGTGVVSGFVKFLDAGDGTTGHVPVVGGPVYLGLVYSQAKPDTSRLTGRLQIYALSQLGEVKNGTRNKYDVTYNEDVDWQASGLLPGFGTIIPSHSMSTGSPLKIVPSGVFADPANQKIYVAINSAKQSSSVGSAPVIHRLSVSHGGGGGGGGTLAINDMTNCKAYLGPAFTIGTVAVGQPMAFDHEPGGAERFFVLNGDNEVYSYLAPAVGDMVACNTALGSFTGMGSGGLTDWGPFPDVHTADSGIGEITPQTHNGSTYAFGISVLESTSPHTLVQGWTPTYSGVPNLEGMNSLGFVTLNEGSHTLSSIYGCYGLTGIRINYLGSQILDIPSAFVSANGLGTKTIAFGTGFNTGPATNYALGPTLFATAYPASNGCPAGTDNTISAFTTMSWFASPAGSTDGPTCQGVFSVASGPNLTCSEASRVAPTNPLPARTAELNSKSDDYKISWDSYAGVGYFPSESMWRVAWAHATKSGVLVLYEITQGGLSTTTATVTSDTSITLDSVDTSNGTGDGTILNPGDFGHVQVCVPDAAGCVSQASADANGNHLEKVHVLTVNPSTKAITFDVPEGCGVGCTSTTPTVGGHVYFGSLYIHGAPFSWRKRFRFAIYPEQEFADVISGAATAYTPQYSEDVGVVAQWSLNAVGDPSLGGGATGGGGENESKVAGVFVDNAHKYVYMAFRIHMGSGIMRHLVYRFDIP